MTESYDGDETMYSSDDDNNDYSRKSGDDGCADFGCLLFIVLIAYALFKYCGN